MELCIDTSTRWAGIALAQDGVIVREASWYSRQNHTMEVAPAVQHLLGLESLTIPELATIVVAIGPGNFSALRTGLSLVKGFVQAAGLPVIAVGSLEVEACPYLGLGRPVCPLLDAGRGNLAWAVYERFKEEEPQVLTGEQVSTLEEVLGAAPSNTIYCGEGVNKVREELESQISSDATVALAPSPTRRLSALAQLGHLGFLASRTADPATLQPRYLRGPAISKPKPPQRIK
jgi:tRNA threonylcarbamoyladenosine biosynthesis protein TsaB